MAVSNPNVAVAKTEKSSNSRNLLNTIDAFNGASVQGCLMLQDTKREKEISLGVSYPYDPLPTGGCIIQSLNSPAL